MEFRLCAFLQLPAGLAANATYRSNGAQASLGQNVLTEGYWYATEKFQAISNEVHLSRELFPGNTLTLGNYTVGDSADLLLYEGSNLLLQAQNNPSPIAINLSNGTNTRQLDSPQGFVTGPTAAIAENGTELNTALILSDSWKLDSWLFDAGFREEHEHVTSHLGHTATADLDDDPYTLYNNHSLYLSGGQSNIYMHDATVDRTTDSSGQAGKLTLSELKALHPRQNFGGAMSPTLTDLRVLTLEELLKATIRHRYCPA